MGANGSLPLHRHGGILIPADDFHWARLKGICWAGSKRHAVAQPGYWSANKRIQLAWLRLFVAP
jgi:hypothetical protein